MKRTLTSFISGILVSALIFTLALSALAISGQMTIDVDPISIQVNGQVFQPTDVTGAEVPVFAYNGTTYAPLRALAEAYGLDVWYDASSNLASVGPAGSAPVQQDAAANKIPAEFTTGYEKANFSRMNSPASENGLGGTKVYVDGIIERVDTLAVDTAAGNAFYAIFLDESENRWLILLNFELFANRSEYEAMIGKPAVLRGEYTGYSEKYQMPDIDLDEIYIKESGERKTGIARITGATEKQPPNENTSRPSYDLSTTSGIESYLTENYPFAETSMGTWSFTYSVSENRYEFLQHDYTINVEYDLGQMNELRFHNTYSSAEKAETKKQLKAFMKTLADDVLQKIGDKKVEGAYHYSYYRYPNLQMDLQVYEYCSWCNYDINPTMNYSDTVAGSFQWVPSRDNEVW